MSRSEEVERSRDKSFKKFYHEGKEGLWMYLQRDMGLRKGMFFKIGETCKYLNILRRQRKAVLSFVCTLEAPGIFLKVLIFLKT